MELVFSANSNWFGFLSNASRWSLPLVHAVVDAVINLLIDKTNRTKLMKTQTQVTQPSNPTKPKHKTLTHSILIEFN